MWLYVLHIYPSDQCTPQARKGVLRKMRGNNYSPTGLGTLEIRAAGDLQGGMHGEIKSRASLVGAAQSMMQRAIGKCSWFRSRCRSHPLLPMRDPLALLSCCIIMLPANRPSMVVEFQSVTHDDQFSNHQYHNNDAPAMLFC